jgi:hypothetical protein
MNIFVLDWDPEIAAQYHCDRHVVKMVLETAQHIHSQITPLVNLNEVYRPTHVNHPCARWVASGPAEYGWTYRLLHFLLKEYQFRYGRVHLTSRLVPLLWDSPWGTLNVPQPMSPPPLCMPDQYKIASDVVGSYRAYYLGAKTYLLKWTRRPAPLWAKT